MSQTGRHRAVTALVVATGNLHKLDEFGMILTEIPLLGLSAFPPMEDVDESAPDFVGNAILKAKAAWKHTGHPALADDSGIAVDALDGRPGVRSARYAPGTDADRVIALLKEMEPWSDRRAQFVCAIAVAGLTPIAPLPSGVEWKDGCLISLGMVHGHLTYRPRGVNGFGYDPIFELPSGQTTAELSAAEKHAISHRGEAAKQLAPVLSQYFR